MQIFLFLKKWGYFYWYSEKFLEYSDYHTEYQTDDEHGNQRNVKFEVFFFNFNIAG